MDPFKSHNLKEITFVLSGVPLHDVGGAAETWVELEPVGEITEDDISPDGQVTVSMTNDARLDVRVRTMRTSGINDRLSGLMTLQRSTPNGASFGPSVLRDTEGELLVNAANTYIVRAPSMSIAKKPGEMVWQFRFADGLSASLFGGR